MDYERTEEKPTVKMRPLNAAEKLLIDKGYQISAIKCYREETGCTLFEGRDLVDTYQYAPKSWVEVLAAVKSYYDATKSSGYRHSVDGKMVGKMVAAMAFIADFIAADPVIKE